MGSPPGSGVRGLGAGRYRLWVHGLLDVAWSVECGARCILDRLAEYDTVLDSLDYCMIKYHFFMI